MKQLNKKDYWYCVKALLVKAKKEEKDAITKKLPIYQLKEYHAIIKWLKEQENNAFFDYIKAVNELRNNIT